MVCKSLGYYFTVAIRQVQRPPILDKVRFCIFLRMSIMKPLLWVIKSWPVSCAKFNALTRMVEIFEPKVLVFRLCPYLLLVSQSHVEVLIACAFFVYFWWWTFNFIIYQLESSDRLTVSSSLYSPNVSLIVFFICFTLSVFDNIDVLSF